MRDPKRCVPPLGGRAALLLPLCASLLLVGACQTVRNGALDTLGDALSESGTSWASDDDPELIRDAAPFSLKLMESLLEQRPRHAELRRAAASGFTQYAYAFLEQPADFVESTSYAQAEALRARARKMYARARDHALAGLEVEHAGFAARLRADPTAAAHELGRDEIASLYWLAAPWGSAIALSKDDPHAVAEFPIVEALFTRALELDEGWNDGAVATVWIGLELARSGVAGDPLARAERRFERALELSHGASAAPYVSFAESVCVQRQDAARFRAELGRALAIDVEVDPTQRLANVLAQRRAAWLLEREPDLILSGAQ